MSRYETHSQPAQHYAVRDWHSLVGAQDFLSVLPNRNRNPWTSWLAIAFLMISLRAMVSKGAGTTGLVGVAPLGIGKPSPNEVSPKSATSTSTQMKK